MLYAELGVRFVTTFRHDFRMAHKGRVELIATNTEAAHGISVMEKR